MTCAYAVRVPGVRVCARAKCVSVRARTRFVWAKVQVSSLTACSSSASGGDPTRARPALDLGPRAGPRTSRWLPAPASVPERRCRDRRLQ
jgi:hypothetical protein